MTHTLRFACLAACLAFSAAAFGQTQSSTHDRTQFGHDIVVASGEEIGEATCFSCSVRVRGHVNGDVTVLFGSVIVEEQGEVEGDITNFGRGVRLDRSSKVSGDVTVFGSGVRRDPDASVGGDVTVFSSGIWLFVIFGLPFLIFAAIVFLVIWLIRRLTRRAVPVAA